MSHGVTPHCMKVWEMLCGLSLVLSSAYAPTKSNHLPSLYFSRSAPQHPHNQESKTLKNFLFALEYKKKFPSVA